MRIGIVGSESSHAMQFAKFYNLPDPETGKMRFEDIRVTAIMGDAESAGETARQADIPHIATTAEEMADMVDAVMITSRRGSEHLMQARPFIAKGMPMFVDKPFTSDVEEAVELASAIEKAGCPVLGGSGCKYSDGVLKLINCEKRASCSAPCCISLLCWTAPMMASGFMLTIWWRSAQKFSARISVLCRP